MTETNLQNNPPDRMARAAELFEFLRTHPEAARSKPEQLAAQYGLPIQTIERLLETARPPRKQRQSFKELLILPAKQLESLLRWLCSASYWVLASPLIPIAILYMLPKSVSSGWIATAAGVASAAVLPTIFLVIFYRNQKSREIFFGSAVMVIVYLALMNRAATIPKELNKEAFKMLLGVASFVFGLLYAGLGEVFLLLGSLRAKKLRLARERELTRQELLTRYFDLQSRLSFAQVTPTKPNRIRTFLKRYSFWIAFASFLVAAFLNNFIAVKFHLAPGHVIQITNKPVTGGVSTNAKDAAILAPLSWIIVFSTVALFACVGIASTLSAIAEKFRTVLLIWLSRILAGVAVDMILPINGDRNPLSLTGPLFNPVLESLTYLILGSLVFLGFRLNREWQRTQQAEAGDADALLGELLDVQWRLASTPTNVCILVVDVVGSTKMKAQADVLVAEYSFGSFQKWIKSIVGDYGGRVEATAGDSAISAFGNATQCLRAAERILADLDGFNRSSNRLPTPFQVRIALHMGQVMANLTEVQFSHVIDVAAHVEKVSPVNGMALTQPIVAMLEPSITTMMKPGPEFDGVSTLLQIAL
jgi:class 3 adenylate cyclase